MITIGKSTFKRAYFNNKKPTIYLGTQLINPVVWDTSLTDKTSEVHIIGDVVLNGKTDCYSLTFEQGGHLTINAGARLRVWEGGITNNDCTTVNYLTIWEDAVNDSYGEFLLHPNVTVNNHPLIYIKIKSFSYRNSSNDSLSEFFAIPSYDEINMIGCETIDGIEKWAYIQKCILNSSSKWENIAFTDTIPFPYSKVNLPFYLYCFTNYNKSTDEPWIFGIGGKIYGNNNHEVYLNAKQYPIANSYVAKISTRQLLNYLHLKSNNYALNLRLKNNWVDITDETIAQYRYIAPLQGFDIINNANVEANITLSYKDLVWDPSFEEEVTPTRSLMKGSLATTKPSEIDATLEGSAIFDNPEPLFLPEHDER